MKVSSSGVNSLTMQVSTVDARIRGSPTRRAVPTPESNEMTYMSVVSLRQHLQVEPVLVIILRAGSTVSIVIGI